MSTIMIDTAARSEFIYIWGGRCLKVFAAYQIRIDDKIVKKSGGLSAYVDASLGHSDAISNAFAYLEDTIADKENHDLVVSFTNVGSEDAAREFKEAYEKGRSRAYSNPIISKAYKYRSVTSSIKRGTSEVSNFIEKLVTFLVGNKEERGAYHELYDCARDRNDRLIGKPEKFFENRTQVFDWVG